MLVESKRSVPLFERLQIESQSHCNRACWFCARTYDRSGDYLTETGSPVVGQMPTDKILDLLDQAQAMGFVGQVGFYFYSEPLLDKRNPTLAREAKKRGMRPRLHTNGDVLTGNDSLCREIAEAYEEIIVGVYDYASDEELEAIKRSWRDKLSGAEIKFSSIGPAGAQTAHCMATPRALVPTDARVAVPDLVFANAPCRRPLIRMLIRYDGEMCNCCEDLHGAFNLGNVYESSLEELWHSDSHTQVIESLTAGGRELYKLCSNCPASPSGPPPNGKKVTVTRRRNGVV
ncbi:MAG: radical SAM protein [Chloroflexi bacterium]|nr:radical SAM protein [Chloroflexota bacterium]